MLTGLIARIDRSAVHDGPGLRTLVFFKGCPLRCHWCHSPETQSPRAEVALHRDRCLNCGGCEATCEHGAVVKDAGSRGVDRTRCKLCGECIVACPTGAREIVGRKLTVAALVAEIERDTVFHDRSGGGVTISGGEPLNQPRFLAALLKACHARRIHTAVETCGYAPPRTLLAVAESTDLFLYDLKIMNDARHLAFTGQSNQRILENLRLLCGRHRNVRVRMPLIAGVNDDRANIRAVGAFLSDLPVTEIDLLPYHAEGIAKYERLDRRSPLDDAAIPPAEIVAMAVETLSRCGLDVHVGGAR
ncbi:MAG TPA: glycyl-radical enzyme activating protein [Vicinamibacterales bacterium]